jgi:hypothetical protein
MSPLEKVADSIRTGMEAVVNDPALSKAATLGRFELGEALRAFPTSNVYKGDLGLMTAGATVVQEQRQQGQQQQQELDRGQER